MVLSQPSLIGELVCSGTSGATEATIALHRSEIVNWEQFVKQFLCNVA
jgi:hypothetical protein